MSHPYAELLDQIRSGQVTNARQFERAKTRFARKHAMPKTPKNADILNVLSDEEYREFAAFLKTKPVRTASGVANIAVMWLPERPQDSCSSHCIYCPQGTPRNRAVPKSYTGTEPTTMRALRNNFDPHRQIENRLHHFRILGQPADKCELIVMGGTFPEWQLAEQERFIKSCFDAFNGKDSANLQDAQRLNETAPHRVVGLTIETRADWCSDTTINDLLRFGCTRVEIGVQSTSDRILELIKRGHDCKENVRAIARLKRAGLKVTVHWMPGLTGLYGLDLREEVELFKQLFTPGYSPDELKIYPTLVIDGTVLHRLWREGRYTPLTKEQMSSLLFELKRHVPPWVRIKRVMRDISEREVSAGPRTTNLRQLTKEASVHDQWPCVCIRCREIGLQDCTPERTELLVSEYEASGGKELFISFEDREQRLLLGFCRLRIDAGVATVRELHVYGTMARLGEAGIVQHRSLGSQLLEKAETIAQDRGCTCVRVTSGIGVREYYRKRGYEQRGYYMVKQL